MLFDRANWPQHRPWLIVCLLATVSATAWFLVAGYDAVQWPGGSSVPGFTLGVVGAAIIVFEFLLWLRRKVRVWPIGSAQTWLRAHIWLGLLCLPLLILHSGFRLGGTLTTTLMVVLILVILSGVWGLVLQNVLPRLMVEELPSEMTFAEMAYSVAQLVSAGDQLAAATSGVKADAATAEPVGGAGPVIVAVGRLASVRMPATPIAEAEGLAVFYREQVAPYLSGSDSPLASASRAATLFRDLKAQLPPAAHDAVDGLESLCRQRRYWDSQARMHFWLHNWLWVHYPLSVALLVLLAAHVVSALRYW